MNIAKSIEVKSYGRKKLLRILIPITSLVVTAISACVIVAAALGLQIAPSPSYWSIIGVNVGLVLAFGGLNLDVYSDRRDVFAMAAVSIGALVPSALTGFSTHQWFEVSRLVAMAGVGFALGLSLSRGVTRRYGIQRSNLLSVVRTALSAMFVLYATLAYIILPVVEIEVR